MDREQAMYKGVADAFRAWPVDRHIPAKLLLRGVVDMRHAVVVLQVFVC